MPPDHAGLCEALDHGIAVHEFDGTFVYANPAASRFYGRACDRLVGARLWDVAPELVGGPFHTAFERVVETRGGATVEHQTLNERWYRSHMHAISGHIHVFMQDVTRERHAEQQLLALSSRSRTFAREVGSLGLLPAIAGSLTGVLGELARGARQRSARDRLLAAAERERRRASILAEASRSFGAAERDTRTILRLLARVAAAQPGECASADLLIDEDATLETIAAHHGEPALDVELGVLLGGRTPLAGSLAAQVLTTRTPLRLHDVDVEVSALRPRSLMMVPIAPGRRLVGTLTVFRLKAAEPYDADDEAMLVELAGRAALAIENAEALAGERRARRAAELAAERTLRLQTITSQLSRRLEPREIAGVVLGEGTAALAGAAAAIWLLDGAGTQLEVLASLGHTEHSLATLPLTAEAPLASAVRGGAPVYLASGTACLPLLDEGGPLGGMVFTYAAAHEFSEDERRFLEVLAYQCAQALDRHRLLAQERVARAALAAANGRLSAIVAASPTAIVVLELDGTVRLWNPAAERIFGWPAAEVVGQQPPVVGEVFGAEFRGHMARVAAGESLGGVEVRRMTRDRGVIDVGLWAAPIVGPDAVVQCLAVVVDITDRKQAEAAARAADRRKDEFLAMLGHELRNPLAPILTTVDLLKLRDVQQIRREVGIIERNAQHLVHLVDDLLDISRITGGTLELRRAPIDLAVVVARALEMVGPLLAARGHELTVAVPRGQMIVECDEVRLAQVIQNLLNNAARYSAPGGRIAVRAESRGGAAVVVIEDDGEGISAELLPRIFEPFIQGERGSDRTQGGLGLGLAVVHSLVALHGGAVTAHSEGPGRGSRFVVTLPLLADIEVGAGPAALAADAGPRCRVLLVDDNEDAAGILGELLRLTGHEVCVAHDAPSALALAPTFMPEVALLDIGLPGMDGHALARELQATLAPSPQFVALTGYGQAHDRRRSEAAGFAEHLVKPVDATRLLALLARLTRPAASSDG